MWALWWLRPVRSAARVGEHSAVVWNWLYATPCAATRSSAGVGTGPPNVPAAPKPTSSSITTTTFGAPSGGRSISGRAGVESVASSAMVPRKGRSGAGRTTDTTGSLG